MALDRNVVQRKRRGTWKSAPKPSDDEERERLPAEREPGLLRRRLEQRRHAHARDVGGAGDERDAEEDEEKRHRRLNQACAAGDDVLLRDLGDASGERHPGKERDRAGGDDDLGPRLGPYVEREPCARRGEETAEEVAEQAARVAA